MTQKQNTTDEWLWTEWKGGDCPIPRMTEFKFRLHPNGEFKDHAPEEWNWEVANPIRNLDITAYAVRNPHYIAPQAVDYPMTDIKPVKLFQRGDRVRKKSGASWNGIVCGEYSTAFTPEGYAVESEREVGSVQIYPAAALERITPEGE